VVNYAISAPIDKLMEGGESYEDLCEFFNPQGVDIKEASSP
jgi:hypothetical protein